MTHQISSAQQQTRRALRLPEVLRITGLPRATMYRWAATGRFPKPFKLGPRASAWDSMAVEAWLAERMQASDDETPDAN